MGLGIGFSSSCGTAERVEYAYSSADIATPKSKIDTGVNPNPWNFTIKKATVLNGHTIMLVNYPNCTTFFGDKLLLLRGIHSTRLNKLDPHFFDNEHNYVVARFKPNKEGLRLARLCASSL